MPASRPKTFFRSLQNWLQNGMDEVHEQFDDPALKGALRQAVGRPSAPPRLRDKVAAMMATAPPLVMPASVEPKSRGGWRIARLSPQLVAAACLALVASGFAVYQMREYLAPYFASAPT